MSLSNPDVIAVCGGDSVNQLGSASGLSAFFHCIRRFAITSLDTAEQELLLERFYKRYLRIEEVEPMLKALEVVHDCLQEMRASDVDWNKLDVDISRSGPHAPDASVADVFWSYFEQIRNAAKSSLYCFYKDPKPYFRPVKLCRGDFASLDREDKRPLEEYDALDGPPFWLAEPPPSAPPRAFKDGKEVPLGTPGAVTPDYVSDDATTATFEVKLTH